MKKDSMRDLIKLVEQADADNMYGNVNPHTFGKQDGQEFTDRGRADTYSRSNNPRFADNSMTDKDPDKLDEFMGAYPGAGITPAPDQLDKIHNALTRAGMTDQEIRQSVTLTDNGKRKLAGALGVSVEEIETLISSLTQKMRDEDNEQTDTLIDDYYSTLGEGEDVPMVTRTLENHKMEKLLKSKVDDVDSEKAKKDVLKHWDKSKTEKKELDEKAPPGKKAERFIKKNKADFKERYGATLTEFVGSYDLVLDPLLYQAYKVSDKLRWIFLRLKK